MRSAGTLRPRRLDTPGDAGRYGRCGLSEPGPLLSDLRRACWRHMVRELPVDPTATMRELDFRSLHQVYATWRGRVPVSRPRHVHISRELLANPDRARYGDGLADLLREIANGDDLRPRTSTAIEAAYTPDVPQLLARRRRHERHTDRLLADWGLHHLHLYSEPHRTRQGFLRRSPHVLFVAFLPDDAYLVDLAPHESDGANWAALEILEVIVRNWPDSGVLLPSNYVTGLAHGNWSDENRKELRAAGLATGAVEIDGRLWVAGLGGQGLTGVPTPVAQHCMGVSWFLSGYQPTEQELTEQLTAMAAKHGVPDAWRGMVDGDDFGFFSGGVFVRYGSLLP
jgi:hypothetical protein